MPGRAIKWQHDKITIPPHLRPDLSRPLQLAVRWLLADVVDTSRRAIISSSQRDGRGHVLHVASRRTPGSKRLGKNNVASPVKDALHHGIKAAQRIAGSIHHG